MNSGNKMTPTRQQILEILLEIRSIPKEYRLDSWEYKRLLETDEEYLVFLQGEYFNIVDRIRPTPEEERDMMSTLIERIYVARNITGDGLRLRRNFEDLDAMYLAKYNDHNGEASLLDQALQYRKFYNQYTQP